MNETLQTGDKFGRQDLPSAQTGSTKDGPPVPSEVAGLTPDAPPASSDVALPQHIGRYRVLRIIGQGGFGLVYLAYDEQLQRHVAVKVPHVRLVSRPEDAEAYLAEARTVAGLDHPYIVPVYDVGSSEYFPCFIVSKYIDGTDLATKLKQSRFSVREAAELTATVAEALHHAHKQELVHRDIKPGNILLDSRGKPFVTDFGLALRERDIGKGPRFAGTPAYMSPEQARGEGHRVDGRSDIFSLGIVFYELLTGRRPFKGESATELLEQITCFEPRPPRQIDDAIPKELDRICLKALAKRASERYSTAGDLAEDLRHFLAESPEATKPMAVEKRPSVTEHPLPLLTPTPTSPPTSSSQPVKVVPKGLRSFDAADADFFLALLPGPRDRDGLPESIRFWKARIESPVADNLFSVGLIYGPSGCGKSSLVKAGLLPRLAKSVTVVYTEAASEETEARLLKGLRRQIPDLSHDHCLVDSLAALRRGRFLQAGQKILLVLDQFEQWLHARHNESNAELVQALRQCDGARVQCLVMVRDDFWMAATRFMRDLEIRLLEGQNSAAVDLFDLLHARKVLAAFGQAYGRLPENLSQCTKEPAAFLDEAVAGLAQDGKVISVRLALFAEMVKGKPWTPTTLKEVGGTAGIGVAFLDETFEASTAPPQHRLHQRAAQAVLKALLPEAGTDIKGHMRSQNELLEVSGYSNRPRDWEELLHILDSEIRLITPTDPEGKDETDPSARSAAEKYYQLTHDYLVPSLRDWLTRKQKETRRGRAALLLADRASVWSTRPEKRLLPAWWEWLNIRLFTNKRDWTPTQRKMMVKTLRYRALRAGTFLFLGMVLLLLIFLPLGWWGMQESGNDRVGSIATADTTEVLRVIRQMDDFERYWADPILRERLRQSPPESKEHLHLSLALLPVDASQVDYLFDRLLDAEPSEVPVLRDALDPYREQLVGKLWAVAEAPEPGKETQRLRATAALAKYDPQRKRWTKVRDAVANDLVAVNAIHLAAWLNSFRPVRDKLLYPLAEIYRDSGRRDTERSLATDLLAEYAADRPEVLADLLMAGDEKQFAVIYPKFVQLGELGLPQLIEEIDRKIHSANDQHKEKMAKRQANAAVVLLRMNQPAKVWPLFQHQPDPRMRSYLIHRLSPLGVESGMILKRLEDEPDVTIRRALVLSLGEYSEKGLSSDTRKVLVPKLKDIYRTADDPGLHAAAEWLLRQWKQEAWLNQVNDEWAKDKAQRTKRQHDIQKFISRDKEKTSPKWYVNGQSQTMIVIPGPTEFVMGSPPTEADRKIDETQHIRRIGRTFAIAAKSVTVGQYRRFYKDYQTGADVFASRPVLPAVGVSWYAAAAYCQWLSKEEGIPQDQWCYEINRNEIKLKANYLSLNGYRLPTEAEIEYAIRAGTVTSRYFGETDELLPKYAWYKNNAQERTWPVGLLKPNDLGLFDALGNVWTWCQEGYRPYPQSSVKNTQNAMEGMAVIDDKEDELSVSITRVRMLRGSRFFDLTAFVRSACRCSLVPPDSYLGIGFRVARTLPPTP